MRCVARWGGAGLVLLALGCVGERLVEHVSEAGGFLVRFPGPASTEPDPDLPDRVQKVSFVERSGSYAVAWEDVAAPKAGADALLDRACDDAIRRLKGKEKERRTIALDGHPGREQVLDWPDGRGQVRQRVYLVDRRLYHVVVSGATWWIEKPVTRKVMDSFQLLEE